MNVTIYTTTTCPYCKMLKDFLKENNISFEEKLVDQDDVAREQMIKESGGFLGVPYTVVLKDDGTKETIVGFDKENIRGVLGLK